MTGTTMRSCALAVLLAGLLPAPAISVAQDRTTAPRAPTTSPPSTTPRLPQPSPGGANAPSAANPVVTGATLVPDLRIAADPLSPKAPPSQFTVINHGGAARPSKLQVTSTLLGMPPTTSCSGDAASCALAAQLNDALQYQLLVQTCGNPLASFTADIPALDSGQSHTVAATASKPPGLFGGITSPQQPQQPEHSYYKQLTLVCVFRIQALADAGQAITESDEQNNELFHYVEREIQVK